MKVTFVVPGYAHKAIGGIRVVYTYANGLVELGHDVTVLHIAMFRRAPSLRAGRPRAQVRELLAGGRDALRGGPDEVTWQAIDPAVELRYEPRSHRARYPAVTQSWLRRGRPPTASPRWARRRGGVAI